MERRKLIDIVLVILAVVFVSATTLAAFYYAPLEPVDVLTVVEHESDYTGDDVRVKGVVHDLSGQDLSLWDISSPDPGITINVTYSGEGDLSTLASDGDTVYVVGRYDPDDGFSAKEVEIADDPDEPAGWTSPYSAKIFYFHVPA
ncbi:MAG: cytochrome c maturation protein CcmE, partial [Thermoplasmata archaeon]